MRPWFRQSRILATLLSICLLWHVAPAELSASDFSTSGFGDRRTALRIGSFNIQVFGESKVNKSFVKDTILSVISRYDIIFIQEIRDDKNKAIYELLAQLNAGSGKTYRALVSRRLGKGEMKEQYAYFYDPTVVTATESYVFHDLMDDFSREPFVARFEGQGRAFTLAGIHIAPTNVRKELMALGAVKREINERFDDNNIFLMGDFNADCSYYKPAEGFDFFDEAPRLLVSDDEDTTVSPPSCAYDRVLGFGAVQDFTSDAYAFNFMTEFGYDIASAKLVSDHFPIEFMIEGTAVIDDIIPIPSKPRPSPIPLPLPVCDDSQSNLTALECTAMEANPTGTSCGAYPYLTPAGYCYASFETKKKRVSRTCCL